MSKDGGRGIPAIFWRILRPESALFHREAVEFSVAESSQMNERDIGSTVRASIITGIWSLVVGAALIAAMWLAFHMDEPVVRAVLGPERVS